MELHNPSILTSNLSKVYGTFKAVDSLTMDVEAGDIFGFLGPNGSGKTTTIRMLCGLILPNSGKAKIAGFDIIKDSVEIRKIIGLFPESSGFYNWMGAEEYLNYFAALYKIEAQIAKKRTKELLEKVGLASKSHVPIGYYSRGMRQRLGLARTLINDPQIIFLDEPTLGLDPKGQKDIQKILFDLNHDKGITIFLSSHALNEVSALCKNVAILNRGRLVAQGTIDELRKRVEGSKGLLITILNSSDALEALSHMPFQAEVKADGKLVHVTIHETFDSVNELVDSFEKNGLEIHEIIRREMNLEEIFIKLTADTTNSLEKGVLKQHA
ncbi:MAG: ABC transporter ATP-binding protein [Thaumarchaeota archaeon]|nr:ABC transporter ATP-binding protein [Nitrososphaerota archaeon]MDE1831772.1 ABC transporter ATP-binding protein [Nitrososphaerota archaeon]MDE1840604.1 ABC transporter ATP-binding protein [Nitrososphaerota archaeon]MDE1877544.1 ABC transporter ATP-binding protein [Nitrososphaerota archaeon]